MEQLHTEGTSRQTSFALFFSLKMKKINKTYSHVRQSPPSSPLPCSRNPAHLFFSPGPPGPIGPAPLFSSRSCSFSSRALPVSPPPRPATAPPEYGFRYPTLARTCGPSGIRRSRVSGCCGSTVAVQPVAGSMDVGVCMSASPRGWAHSADPCGPFSRCPVPRRSSGGPSPESRGR